jgi:hypothetical protein
MFPRHVHHFLSAPDRIEKRKTTLNEIQKKPDIKETTGKDLPAPQGIGMAVAFDWGLAVQILLTPIVYTVFGQSNPMKIPGLNPAVGNVLFFIIAWAVAIGLIFFGEMVRRGRNWTLRIQLVANALLSLAGIFSLVHLYQSARIGNFWPFVTEIILLIFSPLIVWRLSRPSTAHWFRMVTVAEARKRHGGTWVWFIALWAIIGGILQTIAAMK